MAWIARGVQKPPLGAQINPAHPFAQGLLVCVPFNEGLGQFGNTSVGQSGPTLLLGGAQAGTLKPPTTVDATLSGGIPWGSNRDGVCSQMSGTTIWNIGGDGNWLPTTAVTVCVVRRKQDTTNRSAALFGASSTAAERLGLHGPYSDGIVYWDFGGTSSPNRLSVSGLSFSTTIPEKWIVTAGPRGSTIWQNGVKVASQSTAVTRSAAVSTLTLNGGNGSSEPDHIDVNYFAIYAIQWADELCRWWSAEPYAHLYPSRLRSVMVAGATGGTTVKPTWYYHQQWRQAS